MNQDTLGILGLVVTLLVGIATPMATVFGVKKNNDKSQAVHDANTDMLISEIKRDIARLETKQDKYNEVKDRMFAVENAANVLEERIKVANHRIDDLETKINK